MRKAGGAVSVEWNNDTRVTANVEPLTRPQLSEYENTVHTAADKYDPSEIANYVYTLAKTYNKFYHDFPILNAPTEAGKN